MILIHPRLSLLFLGRTLQLYLYGFDISTVKPEFFFCLQYNCLCVLFSSLRGFLTQVKCFNGSCMEALNVFNVHSKIHYSFVLCPLWFPRGDSNIPTRRLIFHGRIPIFLASSCITASIEICFHEKAHFLRDASNISSTLLEPLSHKRSVSPLFTRGL